MSEERGDCNCGKSSAAYCPQHGHYLDRMAVSLPIKAIEFDIAAWEHDRMQTLLHGPDYALDDDLPSPDLTIEKP